MIRHNIFVALTAILSAAAFVSCSKDETATMATAEREVVLTIDKPTRSTVLNPDNVVYALFDQKGATADCKMKLAGDKILIEALAAGRYTLVAMTSLNPDGGPTGTGEAQMNTPKILSDRVLTHTATGEHPINDESYFGSISFEVEDQQKQLIALELKSALSKIELNITSINPAVLTNIESVRISLDDTMYSIMHADGTYSGERRASSVEINSTRYLLTLPSRSSTVSGSVEIAARLYNGTLHRGRYKFTVALKGGGNSTVNIDYTNPDSDMGAVQIPKSYYTSGNSLSMFKNDEPLSVFTDQSRRRYRVADPLQVKLDPQSGNLIVRFFSLVNMNDVKVYAQLKNNGQYFEVAHLDWVPRLIETTIPFTLTKQRARYTTESGLSLTLDANPTLSPNDISFKIVTDDQYYRKISKIKCTWDVWFAYYGDITVPGTWQYPITPTQCRGAIGMTANMAYIFSHPLFEQEFPKWKMTDNGGKLIPVVDILNRIFNHAGLACMNASNEGGTAGGTTYGLNGYIFNSTFPDQISASGATTPVYVQYHEYAHCLGYSHSSPMTVGAFPSRCGELIYKLGYMGELPICSSKAQNFTPDF